METWRIISPSAARWVILRSHGPGATEFTALENKIWQEASSWKGYCERIAKTAADLGHEGFLRVLHELGGDAAASLAAADAAKGRPPAHDAAYCSRGAQGCYGPVTWST